MTKNDLQDLANNHRDLSDAYQTGADAVATAENRTVMNCIRRIQNMAVEPGTCAHPKKTLSRATLQRNHLIAQIAMELAEELPCNIRACQLQTADLASKRLGRQPTIPITDTDTDDEIPF